MQADWFQMPGPKDFVEKIIYSLIQGQNVVLELPEMQSKGLADTVKRILSDNNNLECHNMELTEEPPVKQVFSYFAPDLKPATILNLRYIYDVEYFTGKIIIIQTLPNIYIKEWMQFLEVFSEISRKIIPIKQSAFLIFFSGTVNSDPFRSDILLKIYRWQGIIETTDMLFYANCLIKHKHWNILRKQLVAHLCAELSLWDQNLCEYLTNLSFEEILNPEEALKRYAIENWESELLNGNTSRDILWAKGLIDNVNGRDEYHSSYIAYRENSDTIQKRIWNAEVKVLLPFIELQRQEILKRFRKQIPSQDKDDLVEDLEIGQIWYALKNNRVNIGQPVTRFLYSLWEARNSLAHLEPVNNQIFTHGTFEKLPW